MISFIGYYNYTVILTYISLFCSIAGMLFTVNGWYKMAVLCLALSGLCDMLTEKSPEERQTVRMMKNVLVFRSIPCVTWSALGHFRFCWPTALV